MNKTFSTLCAAWQRLRSLTAYARALGDLMVAPLPATGLVSTFLVLTSPPVQAECVYLGDTDVTYTYTAATINSAAQLQFNSAWRCYENGVERYNSRGCLRSTFINNAQHTSSANTLPYTVGHRFTWGSFSYSNVISGAWYPRSGWANLVGYLSPPIGTQVTLTVPAGQANNKPAGIYTRSGFEFVIDLQNTTASCEGSFGSWDSGSVIFTANFVIPGSCQVETTSDVDFGALDAGPLATHRDATGNITVKCTSGTDYTVYLGDGQNADGSRRMRNGAAYLPYQLYKDAARSQVWDNTGGPGVVGGSGGVSGTGTNTNQSMTVFSRIPAGTVVPGVEGYLHRHHRRDGGVLMCRHDRRSGLLPSPGIQAF